MSLAKRLEEAVREGRATEAQADAILEAREALWTGQEADGQRLLAPLFDEEPAIEVHNR